ncbi:N-formylglutamate amidohydrolase [Streptomyces europaeiscabiei]|uniref:N-formylglutamate amidohydrolase n=1 Tax=Streptomyces europaeiscabiei TaxID=146819 RepID=UPI0007661AAE|nr:N-formylglutamate amidohydrolase [Streptomyces europaeiscabiei]MDX3668694.1 N-formylglutamate amidohydrolase [Streptomyces europaeiscabiei]MDX3837114.1 N-formylglutamate amidohydrolase [Streptomyces europaeiscabiei]MDX3844542.1 N-formylglutamate amidohydrolase [Streptomyces europaeiscabiei]MDX3863942.1 N-formylglutamate amidohydrolase [Streptomyces europaeiscabiei]MDX3870286.1 N-formylglutamate amidohydrolase [Streptomyces europaeiscabiei]
MNDASPSYRLLPGAPESPVLLHVPHGSRVIPAGVRDGIVLDDAALERELDHITDAYTDRIAERAAERSAVGPWRFVNQLSRLVVDPERFPDEREEMLAVGMGAVYTRTTHGEVLRPAGRDGLLLGDGLPFGDGETFGDGQPPGSGSSGQSLGGGQPLDSGHSLGGGQSLIDRYFHPYAAAMTDAVTDRLAAVGRAVIVDVHSYPSEPLPYELHGDGPRPPVCLGTDPFHTPADLTAAAEEAFAGFGGTGVDSPFGGAYVPLKYYGHDPRVTALMIEIRRDVYMTEPGGAAGPGVGVLADALARLVDVLTTV